jgi:hypothetical protein
VPFVHVTELAFVPRMDIPPLAMVALGHVGRLDFVLVARIFFVAHAGLPAAPGRLRRVTALLAAALRPICFAGAVALAGALVARIVSHQSSSPPTLIDG